MRTPIALTILSAALLVGAAPDAHAQRLRMTGTVAEHEFTREGVAERCPGCTAGAAATLDFALAAPLPCEAEICAVARAYPIGGEGGGSATLTIGVDAWSLDGGEVWLHAGWHGDPGSIRLGAMVGGRAVRGDATVSPTLHVRLMSAPIDERGAAVAGSYEVHQVNRWETNAGLIFCTGGDLVPAQGSCTLEPVRLRIHSVVIDASGAEAPAVRPLVIFIGGAMDADGAGNVRRLAARYEAEHPEREVVYHTHNQGDRVVAAVRARRARSPGAPVAVIGHSYGGAEAYWAASRLSDAPIDLLITLDGVSSAEKYARTGKPAGARRWINVHADYEAEDRPPSCGWWGDLLARRGGHWGDEAGAENRVAGKCHVDINNMMLDSTVVTALAALGTPSPAPE